jgi:signal transduction histidine kinase
VATAVRVLVVDDNPEIHEDVRKALRGTSSAAPLASARAAFLGRAERPVASPEFSIDTATQGEEGLRLVREAVAAGAPYALAFVDMRMPPGWDGLRTVAAMLDADPGLQVVLCTAFSDRSHDEIRRELGPTDALIILKKPFDPVEPLQLACTLSRKRELSAQAALRREELEQLVEARTVELRDATARAQAAARVKSEFLANMSHEIRTPLTAMLGNADLLLDPLLQPADVAEHARTIRRNGTHLLAILNDILDLSRIEAGRMTVESVTCSPAGLMHDVADMLRARARQKGLRLVVRQEGRLPATIRTDPTRLRQILVNLCGNAIKFTEAGEVCLTARLADAEGAAPLLEFIVSDTGIGLGHEALGRLFRPFEQADSTTTRRFGGSGLGLAISRRLAHLLGGDVTAASRPGAGSAFTLRIPTGPLEGVPLVGEDDGVSLAEEPEVNLELRLRGHVLLAEDTRDTALVIGTMLRRAGAVVEVVDNGRLALERARAGTAAGQPFDLLLLDMHMPELDGLQVVRQLRAGGYDGPIVALTADSMPEDRAQCIDAGCNDYATKPVRRNDLLALCARQLQPRAAS